MRKFYTLLSREVRSYFYSPIAYIVIGFWALLYGYFFVAIMSFFVRQSMQMGQFGMQGPQSMNINQQMIRPLLQTNLPERKHALTERVELFHRAASSV